MQKVNLTGSVVTADQSVRPVKSDDVHQLCVSEKTDTMQNHNHIQQQPNPYLTPQTHANITGAVASGEVFYDSANSSKIPSGIA